MKIEIFGHKVHVNGRPDEKQSAEYVEALASPPSVMPSARTNPGAYAAYIKRAAEPEGGYPRDNWDPATGTELPPMTTDQIIAALAGAKSSDRYHFTLTNGRPMSVEVLGPLSAERAHEIPMVAVNWLINGGPAKAAKFVPLDIIARISPQETSDVR